MKKTKNNQGMALVLVIVFSAMAMIIITLALTLSVVTAQSSSRFLTSQKVLNYAESGAENALLKLLRNPNYDHEILLVDAGTVIIEVERSVDETTITANATMGIVSRTIQVITQDINGTMTVQSWREIY